MEPRCAEGDFIARPICDRLLSERVASLRRCRSLARRLLPYSSVPRRSRTPTSAQRNKPAANYHPNVEAAIGVIVRARHADSIDMEPAHTRPKAACAWAADKAPLGAAHFPAYHY